VDGEPAFCQVLAVPIQGADEGARLQALVQECPAEGLWAEVWRKAGRGEVRLEVRGLLVDARCSRAVLDLATTDVGRRVMTAAEDDAQSETSEWQLRERREKEEERRQEAEGLGNKNGEQPL
jgi:hypothetical protein